MSDDDERRSLPIDRRDVPRIARLPPSRRHPDGLQRCQRIIRRPGERAHQCKRAARRGFPVCGKHGAGFLAREQSGERLPVRSNLRDGSRARPDTLEAVCDEQPELRALMERYAKEEFDPVPLYRQLLAMTRALADYHSQTANLQDPKQIEKSMALHCKAGELLAKLVTLENEYGPVTARQVDKLIDGMAIVLANYVPKELLSEARLFFLKCIAPDDPNIGIPQREY